jgi:drug/metabolite transporter (DMT)-like permease
MSPVVVIAVVLAAALHASWNAITKHSSDQLALMARMSIVGTVVSAPLLPLVDPPSSASWPWLAASALVHAAYTLLLIAAYRAADFNQVYPIARGLAPAAVAVFAATALGETLPRLAVLGVVLISGGVAAIGLTPWRRTVESRSALAIAGLTGAAIATYTVIDGVGVRSSDDPISYFAWLMTLQSPLMAILALVLRRAVQSGKRRGNSVKEWASAGAAGVMSVLGYGLVLWAQAGGALAGVAALRESSIVFAALIGGLVLREPMGHFRTGASCVVASGAVLLALSGL